MSPTTQTVVSQQALQRLQQIGLEILGQLDLDPLLASILQGAVELLDASQTNLYRYLPDRDVLTTWIPFRVPDGFAELELARGEGMGGTVLARGKGFILADYDAWEGRTPKWPASVTGPSVAVPVRRGEEWLGVITASRPHGGHLFTEEDLELMQLFANQAAVAIANARLYSSVSRRVEELSKLYDTSLDLVSELDLVRVLEATIERATGLLDCRSANLRLYDAQRDLLVPLVPFRQVAHIAYAALKPGEGLSGRVFATGVPLVVNNYDAWEGRSDQYAPGIVPRAMAAPLDEGGQIIGVLVVERTADRPPFTDDELHLLSLFANQASVAITNARQVEELRRLHEQRIQKERLDQQLRTAQAVQSGLLPLHPPQIAGWELAAFWKPAQQIGGDFYDFVPLGSDRWGIVIADGTDKGIPAALLMAVARGLFRVHAASGRSAAEVLTLVNRSLTEVSQSGMFVTALYAILDARSRTLHLSTAGHPPALIRRADSGRVEASRPSGMALGIQDTAAYGEEVLTLAPGDLVIFYTDGVTEAATADGSLFGPERLKDFLEGISADSCQAVLDTLDSRLRQFVGGAGQSDDIAVLALVCRG